MYREEDEIVLERPEEARRKNLVGKQVNVVVQPGKHFLVIGGNRVETQPQRVEQRVYHKDCVDDDGGGEENQNMTGKLLALVHGCLRYLQPGSGSLQHKPQAARVNHANK